MSRLWWMLTVTIVIGLTAFVVGRHIWPMAPDVPMPPANLLPGYIVLSASLISWTFGGSDTSDT